MLHMLRKKTYLPLPSIIVYIQQGIHKSNHINFACNNANKDIVFTESIKITFYSYNNRVLIVKT